GTTLCYAILADVSAEVENEQKYMLQAEMYKILSESADMITFDYAPQEDVMRIVMINPAGGSSEEVVERYMKKVLTNDHIQEDTRDSFLDTLKLASTAPTRGTFDFQWDYYGNGMRWYRAKYVSLADDEGAIYRVVGRLDDISDIKRAERGSLSERKNGSAGPAPEEGQR
uniref:PAS domain-containing protein n=1 Tax=Cloacibacillus evryensis TaxID=508460 RepID=UPI0026DF2920